jgi:hypothetical protein
MSSFEEKLRRVPPNRYNALPYLGKEGSVELTLVIGGMTGQERNGAVADSPTSVEMEIALA